MTHLRTTFCSTSFLFSFTLLSRQQTSVSSIGFSFFFYYVVAYFLFLHFLFCQPFDASDAHYIAGCTHASIMIWDGLWLGSYDHWLSLTAVLYTIASHPLRSQRQTTYLYPASLIPHCMDFLKRKEVRRSQIIEFVHILLNSLTSSLPSASYTPFLGSSTYRRPPPTENAIVTSSFRRPFPSYTRITLLPTQLPTVIIVILFFGSCLWPLWLPICDVGDAFLFPWLLSEEWKCWGARCDEAQRKTYSPVSWGLIPATLIFEWSFPLSH